MSARAAVDREVCMGSGMCVLYAPGTFAHDEEAKAVVLDPSSDDLETIQMAAGACPVGAITIDEGE